MKKIVLVIFYAIFFIGCFTKVGTKSEGFNGIIDTSIYIAQPNDLTSDKGPIKGSGTEFLYYLKKHLNERSAGRLRVVTTENVAPSSDNVISDVFTRAKTSGAEYLLVIKLGEIYDAYPLTPFVNDYVSIKEGMLYRLKDNKVVWQATPSLKALGSNIGNAKRLLDHLAMKVSESIIEKE